MNYDYCTYLEIAGGDSATIYRAVMDVLEEYHVPLHKVIGLCSDGASTMRGVYRGVCTRLQNHIRASRNQARVEIADGTVGRTLDTFHPKSGVFSVHCVCHRLALIVTDAIKGSKSCDQIIPDECLELLTNIYTYFSKSPKRKKKLRDFLDTINQRIRANRRDARIHGRRQPVEVERLNPEEQLEDVITLLEEQHKLPRRIILTRWLSSLDAVKVLVTSCETYKNFFAEETSQKGCAIYDLLWNNFVFAWYHCLLDVLPIVNGMNVLFQSSLPLPHLLYPQIIAAKYKLINMVGTGNVRTALMSVAAVCHDTTFGAYANKYMEDSAWSFTENEKLELKRDWHKLYTHCLKEIDRRFPPANMEVFQLFQVLDPSVVHGPTRRHSIGSNDLAVIVSDLLLVFEIPLHLSVSTKYTISDMKNAFTAFRTSEACADIWHAHATRSLPFDNKVVYEYYRVLLQLPEVAAWAFACLFLLIFPTGNAIAERGFSAMGAVHSTLRSEMGHEQVWAHMIVHFNGPKLLEYANKINVESKVPNWWGHIGTSNYNK